MVFIICALIGCSASKLTDKQLNDISTIQNNETYQKYLLRNSKFIYLDEGIRVHYTDEGKGPVIILIHGLCDSLHTFDGWARILEDNHRVIRLDLLGFGFSSRSETYSRDIWVNFLDKFVTHLKLEKFSIAGNSLGGLISWSYCVKYPHKVESLILLDPIGYPQRMPSILNLATLPVMNTISKYYIPRFMIRECLKQVHGDKDLVTDELVQRFYFFINLPGRKEDFIKILRLIKEKAGDASISQEIKNIKCPVFIQFGEKDQWVPVELTKFWAQDLPHAVITIYKGIGHIPQSEAPIITAMDTKRFLKKGAKVFYSKSNRKENNNE